LYSMKIQHTLLKTGSGLNCFVQLNLTCNGRFIKKSLMKIKL
jgi:hypothetical protein